MTDEFDRISRGGATAAVGLATMDPLKIGEGVATVFGLETNASVVQKATALAHEDFVFESLMGLTGENARHKGRLDTFEQRLAKLTWIIEEFEARLGGYGAVPSDLAALLEASFKVWKSTADAKKRKLLGNALLNAFDSKMYEEGLTLRLLDILSGLTYGDVHTLSLADENEKYSRAIVSAPPNDGKMNLPFRPPEGGSLLEDHYKRLMAQGLLRSRQYSFTNARNGNTSFNAVTPSELGQRLLALVADQEGTDGGVAP